MTHVRTGVCFPAWFTNYRNVTRFAAALRVLVKEADLDVADPWEAVARMAPYLDGIRELITRHGGALDAPRAMMTPANYEPFAEHGT